MPQTYDYLIAPKASFDATADAIRAMKGTNTSITWGQDGFADAIGNERRFTLDEIGTAAYGGASVIFTGTKLLYTAYYHANITSFYAPNCTNVIDSNAGDLGSSSYIFQGCTSLTSIDMPLMARTRDHFARGCTSLVSVNLPSMAYVGSYAFQGCTSLPSYIGKLVAIIYSGAFSGCSKLEAVDILGGNTATGIRQNAFQNCTKLGMLVIRSSSNVQKLENINVFAGSPFASGGTGGTLYVPNDLISSYTSATNWSTILGYTNNQIKSIESTHTDPNATIDLTTHYADGTLIPTT